jgi:K(+)-stimulated pyrophosphate-energized sodium pump
MPERALGIPKPSPVIKGVDLYFDSGSMQLLPESEAKLKAFAGALPSEPSARVTVNGYTDNVGNAAANMRLSQKRANAVEAGLVGMGIPADRLSTQGFGEENPVADNTTAEGRASNRRVSITVGER